jgi:hypothetical protein
VTVVQTVGYVHLPADIIVHRLPDPPFTPRAWMQVATYNADSTNDTAWLIGGQTSHMCGLTELGVCEGEAYHAHFYMDNLYWDTSMTLKSDLLARCGAVVLDRAQGENSFSFTGGRVSYSDSNCESSPVSTSDWVICDLLSIYCAIAAQSFIPLPPGRPEVWSNFWLHLNRMYYRLSGGS